jgi:hypothetical protein
MKNLLQLFFDPEDGGSMYLRNVLNFHHTTRPHIEDYRSVHSDRCENLKTNLLFVAYLTMLSVAAPIQLGR